MMITNGIPFLEESIRYFYWNSIFVSVFTTETLKADFSEIFFFTPLFHNNKQYHNFAKHFDTNLFFF